MLHPFQFIIQYVSYQPTLQNICYWKKKSPQVSRWMWHLTAVSYKCIDLNNIMVERSNSLLCNVSTLLPDDSIIHNHENLKHHTADISCVEIHTRGMFLSQSLVLKCVRLLSYHRKCAGWVLEQEGNSSHRFPMCLPEQWNLRIQIEKCTLASKNLKKKLIKVQ